jgi:thioester reductase-like protein
MTTDFTDRIASLSPAQRTALLKRLKQQKEEQVRIRAEEEFSAGFDAAKETRLDPTIQPGDLPKATIANPQAIFLTGSTGFLGAFLLAELLQKTSATLHCLVRADSAAAGLKRIQKNLEFYGIWQGTFSDRITPVLGDLAQPKFGMDEAVFAALGKQVDVIYHSAASMSFFLPYVANKPINVLGTQEVLRLACTGQLKLVHHVSSLSVFESPAYENKIVSENDTLEHGSDMYLGYAQSKWVGEKLVAAARDRGVPICIYRLPFLAGHSLTGAWNINDFTCALIRGCLQMGTAPYVNYGGLLAMVPVDYPSRAIVHLSRQPESIGECFHLNHPNPPLIEEMKRWTKILGYPIEYIEYKQWQDQLDREAITKEHPLFTLRPFFLQKWSSEQITIPELYSPPRTPIADCEATLKALEGSGISCAPSGMGLWSAYSSFFLSKGMLTPQDIGEWRATLLKSVGCVRYHVNQVLDRFRPTSAL